MSGMIQIRNVPVEMHRALKARAALAAYVALARLLDATLVARDAKLARAPGLDIRVLVP